MISERLLHFPEMPKHGRTAATTGRRSKTDDGGVIVIPNKMKESHAKPPVDEAGLCLANPCRVMLIGGCGASKTTVLQSMLARGAMWLPWEHIYLMAPTPDVATGEYPDITTTFLEKFPPLEYFKDRPGRSALVLDDVHLHDLSTKGNPSQQELCNRICGHLSTHHNPGGLSVFIANQVWTAVPPSIRKLMSHYVLFPQRIARDSIGHIARGVLMTKRELEACCDMCTGVYDFLLITNEPDGRARVRINGTEPVHGIH